MQGTHHQKFRTQRDEEGRQEDQKAEASEEEQKKTKIG
jgi:hypothetical protein